MNGDVQSDLFTLAFKNGEQIENVHRRILSFQQEIILSGETVSTTRLLLQYMEAFSKRERIKTLIAPKMRDLITLIENNEKYAI